MSYSFKEIWTAIYTEMLKVKNTDTRVWDVFNYDVKIEWGINMPAIIITPTWWNEDLLDSCNNSVTFDYSVRVIDEIQYWVATAEDNLRELANIVLERLKDIESVTWTGSNWFTLKVTFNYIFWWADTQEPIRVFEVICSFSWIENK